MNAHNHHRILSEVSRRLFEEAVSDRSLTDVFNEFSKKQNLLVSASDFTDDLFNDWNFKELTDTVDFQLREESDAFFYFNFYYKIDAGKKQKNKGAIILERSNKDDKNYKNTFLECDLEDKILPSNIKSKYKSFFSIINNRAEWLKNELGDWSNQSDCVAFLHAMGAKIKNVAEKESKAEEKFIEHLKACFSEYLLLKNDDEAAFVLGIALHSIMDSFTPSHMGFQHYAVQDKALHAQGDVIPFRGDIVYFEPGQYSEDGVASNGKSKAAAIIIKGFNDDDVINNKEFEMFKIFSVIGGLSENETIQSIIDRKTDISAFRFISTDGFSLTEVKYDSLKKLNDVIEKSNVKYDENSFIYSDSAINVVKDVFKTLSRIRLQKDYNYDKYKNEIKQDNGIDKAVMIWKKQYNALAIERDNLFNQIRDKRNFSEADKANNKNPFAE